MASSFMAAASTHTLLLGSSIFPFQLQHRLRFPQSSTPPLNFLLQCHNQQQPPLFGHASSSPAAPSDHPAQLHNLDASNKNQILQTEKEKDVDSRTFWSTLKTNSAQLRAQVAKLGLAAVLAYGLFDGITYTTFFVLAFLGYEKSTGKNPAANIQALLGIVILMWTGNNVTRPFRVAGAAAIAPFIDKALRKIQKSLKLPNQFISFILVVASIAFVCLSIAGLLILSRLPK